MLFYDSNERGRSLPTPQKDEKAPITVPRKENNMLFDKSNQNNMKHYRYVVKFKDGYLRSGKSYLHKPIKFQSARIFISHRQAEIAAEKCGGEVKTVTVHLGFDLWD